VDAESGGITVRDASSWPAVNGLSYYASAGLNLGSPDALLLPDTQAAAGRFDSLEIGDAPFAPGRFVVVAGDEVFDGTPEEAQSILQGRVVHGDDAGPFAGADDVRGVLSPLAALNSDQEVDAPVAALDGNISPVFARLPGLASPLTDHVPGCTTSTTYALLIQGSDDSAMNKDMDRIKEMFGRGGVPAALVFQATPGGERPVDDVRAKWQQIKAQATPCDHVFIYITAHATKSGTAAIDTSRKYKDGTPVEWDGLSPSDFDFGNCRACHITVIIDTCFSGKALAGFRALLEPLTGRKAFVMSATDAANESISFPWLNPAYATGGAFTTALVKSFNEQVASSGGGNISLGTVFDNANTSLEGSLRPSLRMMNPQWWERKLKPGETCALVVITPTAGVQVQTPTPSPTPTPTPSPTPSRTPTPPPAFAPGMPVDADVVSPVRATFFPDERATTYEIRIVEFANIIFIGDGISWSKPNCGTTEYTKPGPGRHLLRWHHPHPPCDATTDHSDVTITALIVVSTSGGTTRAIECKYQGAETNVGKPCVWK